MRTEEFLTTRVDWRERAKKVLAEIGKPEAGDPVEYLADFLADIYECGGRDGWEQVCEACGDDL